jgi:hypothetical protein
MTALLVIQIMPVKYSIVKDQTPSSLERLTPPFASRTPKITFPSPEWPPSASSFLAYFASGLLRWLLQLLLFAL